MSGYLKKRLFFSSKDKLKATYNEKIIKETAYNLKT